VSQDHTRSRACFASENAGRLLLRAGIVSFKPACPNCDLPRKQNGLVDRLRHLPAQTFASDVVGAEMLPQRKSGSIPPLPLLLRS